MVFAHRQAAALVAQGHDVHLFHLRSRTSVVLLFGEFRRFRREIGVLSPHVVHAHFGTMTALFSALASGGVPLVITYQGSDLNPVPGNAAERLRACLGRGLSQIAALAAAQIVCVSGPLKRRLLWRRERAVVLPTGVDAEIFYPQSRAEARLRLGWEEDCPVILFNSGNGARVKRLDLAQAAVARAQRKRPEVRLEVLDGRLAPELVPSLMNAADCLLLTSDAEGSPTVVQEALASNLPIVSVDVGDVREWFQNVRRARVVERDPEALAEALLELLAQPERSDGRRKLDQFSTHGIATELSRIYRRLAAGQRRGNGERGSGQVAS
ncbi:MAG TPA: glycosyltransferase [Bryobacteraceae bacterium]|nr:glycosyltransferase [Bryobacteraceae bacterium]